MAKRKTAGALSLQAASDLTKYDPLEIGHALTEDIAKHLEACVKAHNPIFDMEEYCVCYVIATDPLIKGVKRRKFYGFPYLPKPRPNQTVFLYNKRLGRFTKRLWVLPNAEVMAVLAEAGYVDKKWKTMQAWSIAFFKGTFWEYIRHAEGINMLSESEFLNANREKLIQAGCQDVETLPAEPFDFSKVKISHINDTITALPDQD